MSATSIRHYLNLVENRTTAEPIVTEGPGRYPFLNQLRAAAIAGGVLGAIPTSHYVGAMQAAGDAGHIAAARLKGEDPFDQIGNAVKAAPEIIRAQARGDQHGRDKVIRDVQKKNHVSGKHLIRPVEDESVMSPVGNGNGIRG